MLRIIRIIVLPRGKHAVEGLNDAINRPVQMTEFAKDNRIRRTKCPKQKEWFLLDVPDAEFMITKVIY